MPYRTELKRPDLKGQFPCSVCGKMFCHSSSLSRHRMQAHFKSYQCMLCDQEIASNETLRSHMFRAHQVSRMFLCRCCNWAFPDKTSLHIHMQSMARSGTAGDVKILAKSATEGGALLQGTISPSLLNSKHLDESVNCSPGADDSSSENLVASGSIFPALNLKEELLDKPTSSPNSNHLSSPAVGQTTLGANQHLTSTPNTGAGANANANPMAMIAAAAAFHNNVFASLFGMQNGAAATAAPNSGAGANGAAGSPRQQSLVNSWLQNNFANRNWAQNNPEERTGVESGCKLETPTPDDNGMDTSNPDQPIDASLNSASNRLRQSQSGVSKAQGANSSPPGASLHPLVDMLYNKKLATTPGKSLEAFLKSKGAGLRGDSPADAQAATSHNQRAASASGGTAATTPAAHQQHTHSPGGQSDSHTSSSAGGAHNLSGTCSGGDNKLPRGTNATATANSSAVDSAKCFECSMLAGKLALAESRNRFLESKTSSLENKISRLEGQVSGLDTAGRRYEHEHRLLRDHVDQLEAKLIRCQEKALSCMQGDAETIMQHDGLKSLIEDLLQQPESPAL